jgi:hypothetical protein
MMKLNSSSSGTSTTQTNTTWTIHLSTLVVEFVEKVDG